MIQVVESPDNHHPMVSTPNPRSGQRQYEGRSSTLYCPPQSNIATAASLDPILMADCDSFDEKSSRICGPPIIHMILARSNRKKLQHRLPKLYREERAEREHDKSCFPSSIDFVSPHRLSKVSEDRNKFYDDLVSIEQPPESCDESEGREDSENIPEFFARQSAEECEQLEKISRDGVSDPLKPTVNGQQNQQAKSESSVDFSSSPLFPCHFPDNASSSCRSKMDSTTSQNEVSHVLTSSTASISNRQKEILVANHAEIQPGVSGDLFSPDKIQEIWAMRDIVLKHQDTLKELADQNIHLKEKLNSTTEQIEAMRKDSAEKEAWSIRINLEKKAFESEAKWLREEVKTLRELVAELKAEDELTKGFQKLMNQSTDDDDKDTIPCTSSSGSCGFSEPDYFDEHIYSEKRAEATTISYLSGKYVDTTTSPRDTSTWWNRMAQTLEVDEVSSIHSKSSSSAASTPRRSNSSAKDFTLRNVNFGNKPSSVLSNDMARQEIQDEDASGDASVTSNSATMYTENSTGSPKKKAPTATRSYVKTVVSAINKAEKKNQDVDLFKSRLDEIQKRRARRKMEQAEKLHVTSQGK